MTKPSHQRVLEEIRRYWQEVLREPDNLEPADFSVSSPESLEGVPADRAEEALVAAIRPVT